MAEEKALQIPVEEGTEKDVSFTRNEKEIMRILLEEEDDEFVRYGGDIDMEVYENWLCGKIIYNRRLFPEIFWWVFGGFPPYCLIIALDYFMTIPSIIFCLGVLFCTALHYVVLIYPLLDHYWYYYQTHSRSRSMGPKGKFMVDFVPALTAAALHLHLHLMDDDMGLWYFLRFNHGYLFLLLGCTSYFYVIAHFMRRAYDISGKDVMLGLSMQTFCFTANGILLVRVVALSFCFGISCYRYMTYSAPPSPPPRPKMESQDRASDRLPY